MSASARIEVMAGNAAGTWLDVTDELLIGRHADGVGRLGDDQEISRYHARLSLDEGGACTVEDLGSTNGTFVNGSRISEPQTLREGDTIELGASTLAVRELPAPAEAGSPSHSPAEAESQATTEHAVPAAAAPPLSLQVEIDFAANEALISLGDGAEPIRIVLESGAWRIA
jgi:pSer/pThr/pTyr-binding forkhead associated (FHA) protein